MRALRHDFRVVYGISYDDVPTDEAIDLIQTLPPDALVRSEEAGEEQWTRLDHRLADILDYLQVINSRLASLANPAIDFTPMERPGDRKRREAEAGRRRERARRTRAKMESTEWEEAD